MSPTWWSFPMVSPSMTTLMARVRQWADSDLTVLILGETGTGKSMLARQMHVWSPRADRPFVEIDCGTVPDTLAEHEFFGSEKGAFTGATGKASGRILGADHGTLLLDEVQNLHLRAQTCLLGLLDTHTAHPIGSTKRISLDIRTVVTSNQDLHAWSCDHRFRTDLYHRINAITVTLPPLRARRDDILPLVEAWLPRYAAAAHHRAYPLSGRARRRLRDHDWPGNIRELTWCLQRAALTCEGPCMEPDDLFEASQEHADPTRAVPPIDSTVSLPQYTAYRATTDRQYCTALLAQTDHHLTRAAEVSGLSRSTLYRLLARLGLTPHD